MLFCYWNCITLLTTSISYLPTWKQYHFGKTENDCALGTQIPHKGNPHPLQKHFWAQRSTRKDWQGNIPKRIFNFNISTQGIFLPVTAEQAWCAPCLSMAAQKMRQLIYGWALQGNSAIFWETQQTWNFLIPLLVPVMTTSDCFTSPTCLSTDTIRKGNVVHFRHRIMWAVS